MADAGEHAAGGGRLRPSRSADAAAIRWSDVHPEDDVEHPPPAAPAEPADAVPNRHSASAEAASLRWQERQLDES